jgi:hypothetical protein
MVGTWWSILIAGQRNSRTNDQPDDQIPKRGHQRIQGDYCIGKADSGRAKGENSFVSRSVMKTSSRATRLNQRLKSPLLFVK